MRWSRGMELRRQLFVREALSGSGRSVAQTSRSNGGSNGRSSGASGRGTEQCLEVGAAAPILRAAEFWAWSQILGAEPNSLIEMRPSPNQFLRSIFAIDFVLGEASWMSACTRRKGGSGKLSGSRNGRCCRPRPGWSVSGSPRTEAYIEATINTHNTYYVK